MPIADIPTYDQLMQPTLDALHALGGQATNQQIYQWAMEKLSLPDEVVMQPHKPGSSDTEIEYRMAWARTYLRHVGLIKSAARSTWMLTELGNETKQINPVEITKTVKHLYTSKSKIAPEPDTELPVSGEPEATVTSIEPEQDSTSPVRLSLTPGIPQYGDARVFLQTLNGVTQSEYREMATTIWAQVGSPQEQVNWTNPDEWIPKRLSGGSAVLAFKIWEESLHRINPRHTRGCWYFAIRHRLLRANNEGRLEITPFGQEFIASPLGTLEAKIDQHEGFFVILRLVAEKGRVRRGDLLDEFAEHCRIHTTLQSESAIKHFLYDRLRNLTARHLISTSGQQYEIAESGLAYLKQYADYIPGSYEDNEKQADIHALAKQLRDQARVELQAYLFAMDPYKFEHLVKLLLEEIGYANVVTTTATNDKGVDVIANIQLGISSVREVVQVKRHKGGISRVVLDQLRGSLYRFDAVRGTIITTGHFSKGAQEAAFERGAAPITLIDGVQLLDLLIENGIGVKKATVEYYEFKPDELAGLDDDDEAI